MNIDSPPCRIPWANYELCGGIFPGFFKYHRCGKTAIDKLAWREVHFPDAATRRHPAKCFDDAQLHQRLQELEAQLARLQVNELAGLTSRFGTIAGADLRTSSTGFNVQGAPIPGVSTITKLPTEQTKTTSAGVETTTTLATEDVTTTVPQFGPPPATAPAASVNMPSSFSVSASDVLDEMMQLQAEINGLRLLLSGDLSSLGFPDAPIQRNGDDLSFLAPTALRGANPEVTVQTLFAPRHCLASSPIASLLPPPNQTERLVLLEQGDPFVRFLLYGTRLRGLNVLAPSAAANVIPNSDDRIMLVEIHASQLKTHKNLLDQRSADARPFLIPIPSLEAPKKPDPPKAAERITVDADEAVIVGEGHNRSFSNLSRGRRS